LIVDFNTDILNKINQSLTVLAIDKILPIVDALTEEAAEAGHYRQTESRRCDQCGDEKGAKKWDKQVKEVEKVSRGLKELRSGLIDRLLEVSGIIKEKESGKKK
jgi:hypothetical protein